MLLPEDKAVMHRDYLQGLAETEERRY